MKTKVFALFDLKAAVYGTPFFMQNDAMAIRSFSDLVNDNQTMVNRHPEDFILHGVGQFDDEKGVLEGMTPWVVATASSLVKLECTPPLFSEKAKAEFLGKGFKEVVL